MKQLTEVGLDYYFSVVLVVLHSCPNSNADAALTAFLSLLEHINSETSATATLKVYINGLFAMIHICYNRSLSCQILATKIGTCFERLSRLLSATSKQSDQYHQVLNYIDCFFTCFREFIKLDNISDLGLLIPLQWVKGLVDSLDGNEVNPVVQCIHDLIECSKKSTQSHIQHFCLCFVKESALCLQKSTFNVQVTVSELTSFLATRPDSVLLFSKIWKYFASEGRVDILLRCSYLTNCLRSNEVFNFIDNHDSDGSKCDVLLVDCAVSGWLQCVALLSDVRPTMIKEISKEIGKLKVIEKLGNYEVNDFSIIVFLKLLAIKHKSASNFLDRMHWTNQAKCWIVPVLDISDQGLSNESYQNSIYSTFAIIIQHCSLLLHAGKPSFVTRSLNVFILNTENHKTHIDDAINKTIDKFMIGCLAIGTKDIYINQSLKRIVNFYLTKWPTSTQHPFLKLLLVLDSAMLLSMLELLYQVLTNDFHTNKLAKTVEILYEWSMSVNVKEHNVVIDFKSALNSVRPQLRFSNGLHDKIDHLLNFFS